ncbi:SMC-Scp complex subunit ScpB [Arthrobacter koreensis]|uniref:SMC-Scp complex subunit ScpB n=1 Tax=Arthrobacter koreensis TaxID=199136 RepID=UPI002DB6F8C7|nr:SMC-Scp complex subunit ScpB [Arthrobacter koreensis]MEB7504278.1 SMC-Scp complex subunit ScpB [Arthrobacter koreensis]
MQPQLSNQGTEDPSARDGAGVENRPGGIRAAAEAVLMVASEPVSAAGLAGALGISTAAAAKLLDDLRREYDGYTGDGPDGLRAVEPRGFELREVAGGWRIYSRPAFADVVGQFVLEGQSARLSQAALETLAVVAYRQPISRGRISAIRGVNVDSVVRTLIQRGLVAEAGTEPETGSLLYVTTPLFLEKLGLGSVEELPEIAPHLPGLENLPEFEETTY